jgi:hypothetical protein
MSRTRLVLSAIGIAMSATIGLASAASASTPAGTVHHHAAGKAKLSATGSKTIAAPAAAWTGAIRNNKSHLCLGIAADGYAGQWNCTGNPDQTWHPGSYDPYGYGFLSLINGDGKCLGVRSGAYADASPVVAWVAEPCNGNPDQYWSGNPNTGVIDNLNGDLFGPGEMVLAVDGSSTANGAPVIIFHFVGSGDQYWSWPGAV